MFEYLPQPKSKATAKTRTKPNQRQKGEISTKVREQVKERSNEVCERCGMARATDMSHLIRRPQLTERTHAGLLAHLCRSCHVFADTTRDGREWLEQFRLSQVSELNT